MTAPAAYRGFTIRTAEFGLFRWEHVVENTQPSPNDKRFGYCDTLDECREAIDAWWADKEPGRVSAPEAVAITGVLIMFAPFVFAVSDLFGWTA